LITLILQLWCLSKQGKAGWIVAPQLQDRRGIGGPDSALGVRLAPRRPPGCGERLGV